MSDSAKPFSQGAREEARATFNSAPESEATDTQNPSSQTWAVIAASGTAGHVYPGIAVAQVLLARGAKTHFAISKTGVGAAGVEQAGFSYTLISGRGIRRSFAPKAVWANFVSLGKLLAGSWQVFSLLRRLRPEVLLSMGGYTGLIAAQAAFWLRIPVVTAEQNAVPGLANKLSARWSKAVATAFPATALPKATYTGNPVRQEIIEAASRRLKRNDTDGGDSAQPLAERHPDSEKPSESQTAPNTEKPLESQKPPESQKTPETQPPQASPATPAPPASPESQPPPDSLKTPETQWRVVILGGSLGAGCINSAMAEVLQAMSAASATPQPWHFFHITGDRGWDQLDNLRKFAAAENLNYESVPFAHNMAEVLSRSHLAVGRAGAGMVAEVAAMGLPAILVPLKNAPNDHQTANAEALAKAGAASCIPEPDFNGTRLLAELDQLRRQPQQLASMARQAASLAQPEAAEKIADLLADNAKAPPC